MTFTNSEKKLLQEIIKLEDKYPENSTLNVFVIDEIKNLVMYYNSGIEQAFAIQNSMSTLHREICAYPNLCRLKRDNAKLEKLKHVLESKLGKGELHGKF